MAVAAVLLLVGVIGAFYRAPVPGQLHSHWGAPTAPVLGHVIYIAIAAFVLNLAVAVIGTLIFRAVRLPEGADETLPHQYTADPKSAPAAQIPAAAGAAAGTSRGYEGPPIS